MLVQCRGDNPLKSWIQCAIDRDIDSDPMENGTFGEDDGTNGSQLVPDGCWTGNRTGDRTDEIVTFWLEIVLASVIGSFGIVGQFDVTYLFS